MGTATGRGTAAAGRGTVRPDAGEMAVRTRLLILAAVAAAAGLAALGTVAAQQPRPATPAPLPATTVRPYNDWTPTPAPAGYTPPAGGQQAGYLQPPPGYTQRPQPGGARPAGGPVLAGPDGVRP